MIGGWEGPAQFVSDFIEYEQLADAAILPTRLMSPDALLQQRKGNSLEMATLLCSLLNGSGYRAMVVSGYATREVVTNNLERVDCPFVPSCEEDDAEEFEDDQEIPTIKSVPKKNKYALRDPIDLRSKFELEMAERKVRELEREKERQLEVEKCERERLEQLSDDPFYGWRVHAWVAIIPKTKQGTKRLNASTAAPDDSVFFIEPSTGRRVETIDPGYLGIESVWNEYNYHVNFQEPLHDIAAMKWDFGNRDHWQSLLVDDLTAAHTEKADETASATAIHKYLDMPHSWVKKLHVSNTAYEEKFPGGYKSIRYRRVIYDRYQNYFNTNGLMKRLTIYETLDYQGEIKQWQWYENRSDLMHLVKIDFKSNITRQYFDSGRPDKLKRYRRAADVDQPTVYYFHWSSRIDALRRLETHTKYIREYFGQRDDKLLSRELVLGDNADQDGRRNLIRVCEKFHRNPAKEAKHDILRRTFDLANGFIHLQFHYGKDEITPTVRVFKRPLEPEYGCEIVYDYENPETNQFNKPEHLTKVEQYLLLLAQLRAESNCKKEYQQRFDFISEIDRKRQDEMDKPILKFSIFDALRNSAARSLRLAKQEQLERRRDIALKSDPDFLASYLIRYARRPLTTAQSLSVKNACLSDIKSEYIHMLNRLQRAYEDQAAEEESLRKFLNKYQWQFEDFEYDTLTKQGERIESTKRVLQQRIETVAKDYEDKLKKIEISILRDDRLNFSDGIETVTEAEG